MTWELFVAFAGVALGLLSLAWTIGRDWSTRHDQRKATDARESQARALREHAANAAAALRSMEKLARAYEDRVEELGRHVQDLEKRIAKIEGGRAPKADVAAAKLQLEREKLELKKRQQSRKELQENIDLALDAIDFLGR